MRQRLIAGCALLVLALAADLRRAPDQQLSTRAAVMAIHGYQVTLSPLYSRMGVQCRFTPSCSHYGEACIQRFGIVRGGWLAVKRVVRCGPWTPLGTADAVPSGI